MLLAVTVAVILTKRLVIATDECVEYQLKSHGESYEDIYNKFAVSHNCPGYYWIASKVFCGMSFTGSSCEHIFKKYSEIYRSDLKEKSGYYHLNNKNWTYCNITEIAANASFTTSTCTTVE